MGLELKPLHGSFLLLEDELALTLIHLWGQAGVFFLHAKVVFDQVEGLLVDLLVLVALQELDLVQAWKGAQTHTAQSISILHFTQLSVKGTTGSTDTVFSSGKVLAELFDLTTTRLKQH